MKAHRMIGNPGNTNDRNAAVAAALAKIRADFIDGLVPLLNEVDYQSRALAAAADVRPAIESIRRVAHKVSGMAGSVGYPELGDHAANLDIRLNHLLRHAPDPRAAEMLEPLLERLMDLMEQCLDEGL